MCGIYETSAGLTLQQSLSKVVSQARQPGRPPPPQGPAATQQPQSVGLFQGRAHCIMFVPEVVMDSRRAADMTDGGQRVHHSPACHDTSAVDCVSLRKHGLARATLSFGSRSTRAHGASRVFRSVLLIVPTALMLTGLEVCRVQTLVPAISNLFLCKLDSYRRSLHNYQAITHVVR